MRQKWSPLPCTMKQCQSPSFLSLRYYIKSKCRPDPAMIEPTDLLNARNGYAMSFRDFVPHIMNVLDQLGMSIHARTTFVKYVHGFGTPPFPLTRGEIATIYQRSQRIKISLIAFYLQERLPRLSIYLSQQILACLHASSLSSAD